MHSQIQLKTAILYHYQTNHLSKIVQKRDDVAKLSKWQYIYIVHCLFTMMGIDGGDKVKKAKSYGQKISYTIHMSVYHSYATSFMVDRLQYYNILCFLRKIHFFHCVTSQSPNHRSTVQKRQQSVAGRLNHLHRSKNIELIHLQVAMKSFSKAIIEIRRLLSSFCNHTMNIFY